MKYWTKEDCCRKLAVCENLMKQSTESAPSHSVQQVLSPRARTYINTLFMRASLCNFGLYNLNLFEASNIRQICGNHTESYGLLA